MKFEKLKSCKKFVVVVSILILTVSAAFASNSRSAKEKAVAMIAKNLSAKLKAELAQENLKLNLTNIKTKALSKNEMLLTGSANCLLEADKTELPMTFEARFDVSKQALEDVSYAFVESAESEFAPGNDEEFLMQNLLKQISRDYKTENVVIAIDGFDSNQISAGQKEFRGSAEVRIGQVEWKKIDFDVVRNKENAPVKISYNFTK